MDAKTLILDLAMNLTRIGNWMADDYAGKHRRIELFLTETLELFKKINPNLLPPPLKQALITLEFDLKKFQEAKGQIATDPLSWAEIFLTWGNILTHRTKLLA